MDKGLQSTALMTLAYPTLEYQDKKEGSIFGVKFKFLRPYNAKANLHRFKVRKFSLAMYYIAEANVCHIISVH